MNSSPSKASKKDSVATKTSSDKVSSNPNNIPSLGKIQLSSREIEEIKLLSQGGYAYIFKVKDTKTNEIFALKKMICQSSERLETAKNEIAVLTSLPEHQSLLKVFDSQVIKTKDGHYAYILLEFCEDGSLFDLMVKHETTKMEENQIINIMREICDGVKVLHSCNPPIVHRDLKIENVLLHKNKFKLCDFGSCTSKVVDFAQIPQTDYVLYEEEYEKNTTLMYRPPEMCDLYMKYTVNEKVDIWMLGCILYALCFYRHPFQGASKLAIVNANLNIPKDHSYPEKLTDLIRLMLTPNPQYRPSITEIVDILDNYSSLSSITLNPEAQKIKEEALKVELETKKLAEGSNQDIPLEELMKIQMKLKESQNKETKDDDVSFKKWTEVKYPKFAATKNETVSSNQGWADFGFDAVKSDQGNQQSNSGFDAFDQFSGFEKKNQEKESNQTWDTFEFGGSQPAKPKADDVWGDFSTTKPNAQDETQKTESDFWSGGAWGNAQSGAGSDANSSNTQNQSSEDKKNAQDSFGTFAF